MQFIDFDKLNLWDAASYTSVISDVSHKYPLVKLNTVIEHRSRFIKIDDQQEYKRCRVQLRAKGIELRDVVNGSEIKTKKQQVCNPNEFLVAEIDAKHGGYGIVPSQLDGAIVSSHYFLYEINTELLLPEFLGFYIKTAEFFNQIQAVGSTNYAAIRPYQVLEYKIPLPSKAIQTELVNAYESSLQQAQQAEQQANQLEKEIESYLLEVLGIEIKQAEIKTKNKLCIVNSKDLTRWDVWNSSEITRSNKYLNTVLGNVVLEKPKYGANLKAVNKKTDVRYIRITDINEDGSLNDDICSAESVDNSYLLEQNDFLIARTGATVGKTFLYKTTFGKAIYAGYLVKYKLNEEKVLPEYLFFYTKSEIFKNWIMQNQRVSAQPNINGQEFLNSTLILPPLEIQTQIVSHINEQKTEIKRLRTQARTLIEQAKSNFERAIFE